MSADVLVYAVEMPEAFCGVQSFLADGCAHYPSSDGRNTMKANADGTWAASAAYMYEPNKNCQNGMMQAPVAPFGTYTLVQMPTNDSKVNANGMWIDGHSGVPEHAISEQANVMHAGSGAQYAAYTLVPVPLVGSEQMQGIWNCGMSMNTQAAYVDQQSTPGMHQAGAYIDGMQGEFHTCPLPIATSVGWIEGQAHHNLFGEQSSQSSRSQCTSADWSDQHRTEAFLDQCAQVPRVPSWVEQAHCSTRWEVDSQAETCLDESSVSASPANSRRSSEWAHGDSSPQSFHGASATTAPSRRKLSTMERERRRAAMVVEDRSNWTCRMLRNLPNDYSRNDLLEMLDSKDIEYDFVYLPIDWAKRANLGYAFVNLVSNEEADRVEHLLRGFSEWKLASEKICEVVWGKSEQQSVQKNIEHLRNSPVMHPDVPEEFKPLLFSGSQRIPFPAPTKALRPPRGFLLKRKEQSKTGQSASEKTDV